jgi:1,2-beta-oligoglucan phosphorylase
VPRCRPAPRPALELAAPTRSLLLEVPVAVADALDEPELQKRYPRRTHVERVQGAILSFFIPQDTASRHVVLRDKERRVLRRHGTVLRSGTSMLPEETSLCTTCWMHGVFGAQLAIGNTSFHRLFSISRDPYNIGRGSGLRMLVDTGAGWRLLAVPSALEIGLADCRWIYRLGGGTACGGAAGDSEQGGSLAREGPLTRTITVSASVSADEPAAQWRVRVDGEPCRFLVFCHLALGEREFEHAARVELDAADRRFSFRPDPQDLWGRQYPQAVYHLVTSTPECVEIAGGDELLYADGRRRSGGYAAMRTAPTRDFVFAVVGSLTDPEQAAALAARYQGHLDEVTMQARATRYWGGLTRGLRIAGASAEPAAQAIETILPWLAHDAMIHLTVPQGLEQYSGAAWGTRDVCQGPIELLLALGYDAPAAAILRRLFAQQYTPGGDWPQWFMLEPYAEIRDRTSHGDVIVWPLKALCDYVEATGDLAILEEALPWRDQETLKVSADCDPLAVHVERLISTVRGRFVPGTHLIRYGNGDWNDSLQPVDASLRERMVSSWTVALLYEQLRRYAEILRRAGRADGVAEDGLASAMREDFNRLLVRDGVVAGYAVFSREGEGGVAELLFHPLDERTGVRYSLLPMTQAIIGGLFTPQQAEQHRRLIREKLSFPDGVRLMDRPIAYHGGPQALFQRAESSAFFGREIGLMYTHAHLRYAQAMGVLGLPREMWDALVVANPIAVTEQLAHATLRQRNTYFSSSDAAFADRYEASLEWLRVRTGAVAVDGGWRMYSSGPGIYTNLLVCQVFGLRRSFGTQVVKPCLPAELQGLSLEWSGPPARGSPLQ